MSYRSARRYRRFRRSITLELFTVMFGLLFLALALVVVGSGRFLQSTARELAQDQGEENLRQLVHDKTRELDEGFDVIERIVDYEALAAERLEKTSEAARDVTLVDAAAFADPATRPADYGPEPGKNRKVSLGTVMWSAPPHADADEIAADRDRLRGLGFTMRALYQDNPLSSFVYLGTESGLFLGYPADASLDASYDPRTRDWYHDARDGAAGVHWSTPYKDPSGALTITCSRVFRGADGKTAGVVAVDVTIDQLQTVIGELEEGLHGYAVLVDGSGGTITEATHGNTALAADPTLAGSAKEMAAGGAGLERVSAPDGTGRYLAFDHIAATNWSLGVLVGADDLGKIQAGSDKIAARVDEARSKFLHWGMGGIFFLLVWTTTFVYVRLTQPIKSFIRDIRVISKGNLEHKLAAPHDNELADLASAFNDMTEEVKRGRDQIEEYSRTLEKRVEERTAELAASNAELADAIRRLQDAQTKLVHSEKMASLGQLVAGIAHEINNPVNFIANSVGPLQSALEDLARVQELYDRGAPKEEIEALKAELGFDEAITQMRRALELIKTGASRTKSIVLQLRNFSRLDEAEMKEADIHEGLDGSLALLNYKLKDKIEVERDYGKIGRLACYPGQLNQVFMNILANGVQAIESSGRPGKITISTRRDGDAVVVRIKDSGTGIPAHVLPKIFDPFFTTKDRERGTGLGLSISHGIVEKHGGRIDVLTEMGKGTEFVITLPVSARTGAAAAG